MDVAVASGVAVTSGVTGVVVASGVVVTSGVTGVAVASGVVVTPGVAEGVMVVGVSGVPGVKAGGSVGAASCALLFSAIGKKMLSDASWAATWAAPMAVTINRKAMITERTCERDHI